MRNLVIALLIVFAGSVWLSLGIERGALYLGRTAAADSGSGSAVSVAVTTGSGSGSSAADKLAIPEQDPGAALSQVEQAKTHGWPLVLLTVLVIVLHGIAYASNAKWISWLSKDSHASILAAVSTVVAAAYNAFVANGSYYAVAAAIAGSLLLLKAPQAPQKSPA